MAKEWKDDLEELCEKITEEISEANKKLEKTGGKMTAGDLEYIDKLTHALKSIKTTLAMAEYDDEYSGEYSGARGRGRNARRDSMGRYSSNRYYDDGYSMEGDFRADLEELMRYAPNDQTKQKLQAIMAEM